MNRRDGFLRRRFAWWTALPLVLVPTIAAAQAPTSDQSAPAPASIAETSGPQPATHEAEQVIEFSSDQVTYDNDVDVVTATGSVRMQREGNYVAADQIVWNRKTGEVRAVGNVVAINPQGDKFIGDNLVLSDTLRDGTVDNLLLVLESGGRIAASHGRRAGDVTILDNAIYSPCPVTTETGCPRNPSWAITATRVTYDPNSQRVRFQGGRMQIFGVTLPRCGSRGGSGS